MSRAYADNLRKLREARSLSVAQLSKKTGVSEWKIRSIQRGGRFRVDDFEAIREVLDCSYADILGV